MADIFISYNREDRRAAGAVASALEREGFSVWWDAALRAGESYDEVTEKNLREAKAVVVLWSKRSAVSKWVRAEATIGERHSTLVPVMIEECDRPLRFELIQTADLTRWHGDTEDHNWRQFVGDIRRAVGDKSRAESAAGVPTGQTTVSNAPGDDATIETTFWTSIKDGNDPSDFEAYLHRYPHGHFAALAQNRLTALARAKTPPPAPVQRPAAASQPLTGRQPQQTNGTASQQPPRQPAPRSQQQQRAQSMPARSGSPEPKKGGAGMIIGLGAVALIAVAGVVFFALRGEGEGTIEAVASIDQAPEVPARQNIEAPEPNVIAEPNSEPAEDTFVTDNLSINPDPSQADFLDASDPIAEVIAGAAAVGDDTAPIEIEPTDVDVATSSGTITDCADCPRLIEIPAGKFLMGSPSDEIGRNGYEGPQKEVDVAAFLIGETEVTASQWAACVEDGGCNGYLPGDEGYGGGDMPVMNISWRDAISYVDWLTSKTGKRYRLPTEAEWEYAARGGSITRYWWGDAFERSQTAIGSPKPVGSFEANAFGLRDVTGNVREWVQDCYVNNYTDRPSDASAVTDGDCSRRVIRGGSWQNQPNDLRVANRIRITSTVRDDYLGFRVARDK